MYEPRGTRPLPTRRFLRRVAAHFAVATGLVSASLLLGMAGYAHFEGLAWRDAFLNSAMLLGGTGPVDATSEASVLARGEHRATSAFISPREAASVANGP